MTQYPKAFIYDLGWSYYGYSRISLFSMEEACRGTWVSIDRQFNEQLKGISRMESLERILELNSSLLRDVK